MAHGDLLLVAITTAAEWDAAGKTAWWPRSSRSLILASHPAIYGSSSVTCARRGMPPGGWRLTTVTIVLPPGRI